MRSKRVLTLLLAVCMVLSLFAAPVTASTTDKPTQNSSASNTKENSLLVGKDTVSGLNTLRDQNAEKPTVNGGQDFQVGDGSWSVTPSNKTPSVSLTDTSSETIQELKKAAEYFADEDLVSAFIVMEQNPMVDYYGSINDVPSDETALLEKQQEAVITMIEEDVLDGEKLSVITNFTYLSNSVVVKTQFGNLEAIASLPGVKTVFLSPIYYPCATETTTYPQTVSSGKMSGVSDVWTTEGLEYTGKGLTIAILDTGLDLDHPSFAEAPALGDSSWDAEDVAAMLENLDLNASKLYSYVNEETLTVGDVYYSEKIPFIFNYASGTTDVTHADGIGDHGTHVAGIAGANAVEGTGVVGMAPDAQIVVMKVFNSITGGAYMFDILTALEDAMAMGVDVANLSLGSPAGFGTTETVIEDTAIGDKAIDEIFANIAKTDLIVDIAAGNEGTSSYGSLWGTYQSTTGNIDNATVSSPSTYANAMSVASVDNKVVKASYFTLADGEQIFYMPSVEYLYEYIDYSLEILAGQELEYVIVPGLGAEADFYDEEGNSIVEGKIAVVLRGELAFGEKAYNAQNAGALAILIWDNVDEDVFSFGMQTETEYGYPEIPVVLISLSDGQKMADAETKTMTANTELGDRVDPLGGQVSSFSSWGVSPELGLLPDIAGVGGNIYSTLDGGNYGLMSGTSMATPQVAGITALVLQYLKDAFPEATVSEIRTLADSLMMSTAVPVIDEDTGLEASPRQQGSGLVNALYAVTSEAYLTVSGSDRPKAELYDSTEGKYSFTFTVHNYGDEDKTYTLSSSLLCEDYAEYDYYPGVYFMAESEHELDNSAVSISADSVTVKAGESVDVTVTIDLTEADKKWIDTYFENGNYVEGYIYLNSDEAVDLSLPFLGFYGDWTDAPVFDTGYWYDEGFWADEPVVGEAEQFYHYLWTSLSGGESDWVLGFSPYADNLYDAEGNFLYDSKHNVISPNGDGLVDQITDMYLSLLRNAKYLYITYTDEAGNVLHEETIDHISKTMFNSSYGGTIPFVYSWYYDDLYDFTDENGEPLPDGTKLTLNISAELDYEGAQKQYMEQIPIAIDTTAPVIDLENVVESTEDDRNYLTLTVSDYALAAVVLLNTTGTQKYATYDESVIVDNGDGTQTVKMDITGLGDKFMVVLCDYGCNESYYDVTFTLTDNVPEMDESALYAYRVYDEMYEYYYGYDYMFGWTSIDKETADVTTLSSDAYEAYALIAAEYVDGQVFAVDADYNFIRMTPGLWNRTWICNLGTNVTDMAFDETTGTMYLAAKGTALNYWGEEYEIYTLATLDLLTGEVTVVAEYESQYDMPWAMTCVDGQLYAIKYFNSGFYMVDMETYELVPVTDAEGNEVILTTYGGADVYPLYSQSMTYSANDGKIYWAYYSYSGYELFTIDPSDASFSSVPFAWNQEFVGLLTIEDDGYTLPESEAVTGIVLDQEMLIMAPGDAQKLTASLLPWNAPADEIVWTSDDESVATVNNGVVTAVAPGSTTVTASHGDATASCTVNVVDVKGNLYAYNYFSDDYTWGNWLGVDLNGLGLTDLAASPVDFIAADYNGHDGYVYGYNDAGQCYKYDITTGECTALGISTGKVVSDMAYDYSTGLMYAIVYDANTWTTTIYNVNMSTGALVEAAVVYNIYLTLACDSYGILYAISYDGTLCMLNMIDMGDMGGGIGGWEPLSTGGSSNIYVEEIPVMTGLGVLQYLQTMCYDHNNDVILWISPDNGGINWIDLYSANEPYMVNLGTPAGTTMIEYVGAFVVPEYIPELGYYPVESVEAEDMVVLEGCAKLPMVTIDPLNATSQNVTYVSADESIAKIENGAIVGVSAGATTVTGTLVDGEKSYVFTFNVSVKKTTDNIFGYLMADLSNNDGYYWMQLNDTDPTYYMPLAYVEYNDADLTLYSAEYVDGYIYAYGFDDGDWSANFQFLTIDAETWTVVNGVDMGGAFPFVYDMAYDYTTGTMYAVAGPSDNTSNLYMVNLTNGQLIDCMVTDPFLMSLAIDGEGNIYAIAASEEEFDWETWSSTYSNAIMYKLDVDNGTCEPVLDTGCKLNALASMAYDHDTGYFYWTGLFQGSAYEGGLFLIDLEDGTCSNLGSIGVANSQVSSLIIIADEYPEVPEDLQKLTLTTKLAEIAVDGTATLETFLQPFNADVELTWTSSDETIATVDENGTVTGLSAGVATITVTVEDGGKTFTATCTVIVYGENDYFLTYNWTDGGFSSIGRPDPAGVTNLTENEEESGVTAMTMVNGIIYAYDEDNNLFWTMQDSGFERHYIGNAGIEVMEPSVQTENYSIYTYTYNFVIRDMAWDAANGRLLALGVDVADVLYENTYPGYEYTDEYQTELEGGCKIYEVDLETGALTELLVVGGDSYESGVSMLEITADGEAFVYSYFMDYVSIMDLETGALTYTTTFQNQGVYPSSDGDLMAMVYDDVTGALYMLVTENGKWYSLYKYDIVTQVISYVGDVGEVIYDEANWTYNADSFAGLVINEEHVHNNTAEVDYPTCTEDGSVTYTCTECGHVSTEVLEATGHNHEAVIVDPTCTEDGSITYTCTECGDTYTEILKATGHTYVNGVCVDCGVAEDDGPADTADGFTALWTLALLASMAGAAALVLGRKKWFVK